MNLQIFFLNTVPSFGSPQTKVPNFICRFCKYLLSCNFCASLGSIAILGVAKSSQNNIEEREHGVEGISLHSSLRGLGIFQLGLQHQNDKGSFGPYGHK